MTRPQPIIMTGAQAVSAARAIKAQHDKQSAWPYEWAFPPENSANVFRQGSLLVPVAATQSLVLQYNVPDSLAFVLTRVCLLVTGVNSLPGDFTWTLDVNLPLGSSSAQGTPLQGFGQVQTQLGSFERAWDIESGELDILKPRDQLRAKVVNNNLGAGNGYFVAMFVGYTIPA